MKKLFLLLIPSLALAQPQQGGGPFPTPGGGGSSNNLSSSFLPVSGTATNLLQWSVKDFGAVGNGRMVNTCRIQSNSPVLIVTGGPFVADDVGKVITVYGAGRKPAGFTTTNQALNLSGTILSFQNTNQVTLSTNCQQDATNKVVVWGTDDTVAINTGLHYVATNSGSGGTLYFPAGIYTVNGAPFDTNMTGINLGGVGGFHEPKNAQLYFPDYPNWASGPPQQAISVTLTGPVGGFIVQAIEGIDLQTNRGAVIWSTRADLNGASVLSCIQTNGVSASFDNPSCRYWDGNGNTNKFYATQYHVDINNLTIRVAGNPTGPAVNLCGAGTITTDKLLIDSGHTLYNNLGKPMNTNGYGLIGPTPSSAGSAFIQNTIINGFYTGLLMPEHMFGRGVYIFSCLYGVETSSGHPCIADFDIEDCAAWFNNRNHIPCGIYVTALGENVSATAWSYPGVLVTNDSIRNLSGQIAYNSSTYGVADMPGAGDFDSKILFLNMGNGSAKLRFSTPIIATNITSSSISPNFIGLTDNAGNHGALAITGADPWMYIDGTAVDGTGNALAIWGENGHNWRFGANGVNATIGNHTFTFFNYTLFKDLVWITETGNLNVVSNLNANALFLGGQNTAAFTLVQTNFISGFIYTNFYGAPIQISSTVALVEAATTAGAARLEARAISSATNYVGIQTTSTSLADTNSIPISIIVPINGTYTFTNVSTGVGNSATVLGGQIMVY